MALYRQIISLFFIIAFPATAVSQKIIVLDSTTTASLRGLSVVSDKVIWVSGSKGTVGKSLNGGKTWQYYTVPGFANGDFRDIEAFDAKNAVIMNIQKPACILKTTDGGTTWQQTFSFADSSVFLDAMEFWNEQSGILIGDPINSHFIIARTFDGGKNWQILPPSRSPIADSDEACFASSGTNVRKLTKSEAVFISGGLSSNFFYRNEKQKLPLNQGKASTGANSIAIKNKKIMVVVGGDFLNKNDTTGNACYTLDGGKTWVIPEKNPSGYRSCVEFIKKSQWITCGLNGVDESNDDGKTWEQISSYPFHVVRRAKKGNALFLAGSNGRIGKLESM
ncbi:MAG: oxidoreductase [Bacteroidetes bacterium]|nr:oxidoreductase [Bacteroidota bacterium]